MWKHPKKSEEWDKEKKEKEFSWLLLEYVLLLFWEENYPDQLAFESGEVGPGYAEGNAVWLSIFLENYHFLFAIDLNDSSALENKGCLIDFLSFLIFIDIISFFSHRDWLTSKSALVDKSTSLKYDPLER